MKYIFIHACEQVCVCVNVIEKKAGPHQSITKCPELRSHDTSADNNGKHGAVSAAGRGKFETPESHLLPKALT